MLDHTWKAQYSWRHGSSCCATWPERLRRHPALEVLEKDEVDALVNHFGKGKAIPAKDLSIGQAVLWIGRLGGHLNRRRDGMPGVRTMWRGLQALALLVSRFRAGLRAGHQMLLE